MPDDIVLWMFGISALILLSSMTLSFFDCEGRINRHI